MQLRKSIGTNIRVELGVSKKLPNLRQNKKKYSVALLGSFSYTSWENCETIRAIFPCYLDHKK